MAIKESNITLNVHNLDRSVAFYESLGLITKTRYGNHYAQLTAPGIVIGLHPTGETNLAGNSGNVSIGFISDDFEETISLLQELAINVRDRQEEGGRFLHFNDPDGTALYFIKPKW